MPYEEEEAGEARGRKPSAAPRLQLQQPVVDRSITWTTISALASGGRKVIML